ncbi:UNVERIFIED_CONTAM: hypothetical protein GTU68_049954 [Idotea baltica]|nr:hypothetical protein [Idotea baltica]
MAQMEKLSL